MAIAKYTRRIASAAIALHRWALNKDHDKKVVRQLEAHATLRQHDEIIASMTRRRADYANAVADSMNECRSSWEAMSAESAKYPRG